MSITAGVLSSVFIGSTTAQLVATAATAGTAPYTYQWYRDTSSSGFTPGGGNILTGQTALTLNDTNLVPNTTYYYKVIATVAVPASATYAVLTVTTTPASLNPNQFAMLAIVGTLDLRIGPTNVFAAQIDTTQATALYPGQPVKFVNNANGIPTVIAAGTSTPNGYICYDQKSPAFTAGMRCEIASTQTCMWLYSTAAIARGTQVTLDPYIASGVRQVTGSSGYPIVGYAFDQATASGQLLRIILNAPSFRVDS